MTQREFWKQIEARTSKEVADFGFSEIVEGDLPGCRTKWCNDAEATIVTCADLDAAAAAAQQACDASKGSEEPPQPGRFYGTDVDTFYVDSKGQPWLIASTHWTEDRKPMKAMVTTGAKKLNCGVLDQTHHDDAAEIEAAYE